MIIDDLAILGRGAPDRLKDFRETVCTAGYSNRLGFIRIYPTKTTSPLARWNVVNVEVDRDSRDTRNESWKVVGSKREWDVLNKKIKVIGVLTQKEREAVIVNHLNGCVLDINDERRSLGIIKPTIEQCYFGIRKGYTTAVQPTLMDSIAKRLPIKTKRNFPLIPKIVYRCSNCRAVHSHDQQVIDWGFYEWLRKYPNRKDKVWEAAKIVNSKSDIYFLVGNQMIHRNSFMIISVFSLPKWETAKAVQATLWHSLTE